MPKRRWARLEFIFGIRVILKFYLTLKFCPVSNLNKKNSSQEKKGFPAPYFCYIDILRVFRSAIESAAMNDHHWLSTTPCLQIF
mmetsp:Transcript_10358/g.21777  ORF Transcript_10358/g.21777 Transcript_10358/m.21777 type:complete len:84 (-) Transcript_10358:1108-1359(-)